MVASMEELPDILIEVGLLNWLLHEQERVLLYQLEMG